MWKKGLLAFLILMVLFCLCTTAWLAPAVFLINGQGINPFQTNTPTPNLPQPVLQPTLEPQMQPVPENISSQMDQIQSDMIKLRGLEMLKPFSRDMLTADQLREKVETDFFGTYTPQQAADDALLFGILGVLEPDVDLISFYTDLYSEQVAGYYDPETKEMYVVNNDNFSGVERMTYAHEFTHTLQDQHYDLRGQMKVNDEYCLSHAQYCAAVSALVEGDALSSEQTWFYTYGTDLDRSQVQNYYFEYSSPIYDSSPEFIKEDLLFPYQKGFEFVQTLYDQGGWTAVDQAYNNPPVTTEQILHPNLYPDEKAVEVNLPDLSTTLGADWRQVYKSTFGEWYTYLVLTKGLDAKVDVQQGLQAAAGWGGDTYVLYQKNNDPQSYVFVAEWKWDTSKDADQFWATTAQLNDLRWENKVKDSDLEKKWEGKNGVITAVQYTPQGTRWIVASNQGIFDQVRPIFK